MNQFPCGDFSLFLTIEFTLYIMTQPVCSEEICVYESADKILQLLIKKINACNSVVYFIENTGLLYYKYKTFGISYGNRRAV